LLEGAFPLFILASTVLLSGRVFIASIFNIANIICIVYSFIMSLSKELQKDPFNSLPPEILFIIAGFLDEAEDDLLHLGMASPAFRTRIVLFRDLKAFKTSFIFQGSFDGRQHPCYGMEHIRAEMTVTPPDNSVFEEAFNAILTRRCQSTLFEGCLRNGDVVVVVAPDVRRAENFSCFFELQAVPGFQIVCNRRWKEKERSEKAVTVVITSRTDVILPRPRLAIFLAPAGAKPVTKVLHLGPAAIRIIWPLDDGVGQNYSNVRKLLWSYDRRQQPMEVASRRPVVRLFPEGMSLTLSCFRWSCFVVY